MDKEESLGDTIKTIVYAILIAIVIRTLWFEPFKIPSGSMYPTLYVGDYLFVSKYTYGYSKHSLPWSIPLFEGRIWKDAPKRGDVVVFKYPRDNRTDSIKRVIGLPGDTIKLENGRLFINGQKITHVLSVKSETTFADTVMTIKFNANYKSDYLKTIKEANSLAKELASKK